MVISGCLGLSYVLSTIPDGVASVADLEAEEHLYQTMQPCHQWSSLEGWLEDEGQELEEQPR
jgi:hypothetical protein